MSNNFKFSIVINTPENEKYLEESIASIISQDIGFEKNVQIIIIDNGNCSDYISLRYNEKYPENIIILNKDDGEDFKSFINNNIKGEFINFLNGEDKLSSNALNAVYKFFQKNNKAKIACIATKVFNNERERKHALNFRFREEKLVDLNKNPEYPQSSINPCFIKVNNAKEYDLNLKMIYSKSFLSINKILLDIKKIGLVFDEEAFYYKRIPNNQSELLKDNVYLKNNFNEKFTNLNELIDYSIDKEGKIPEFIKHAVLYGLKSFELINEFPDEMPKEDIKKIFQDFEHILNRLDKETIKNTPIIKKINYKRFLLYLRNHQEFHIETEDESKIFLKSNTETLNKLQNHKIYFDIIEIKNGMLYLSGSFVSLCDNDALSIEAIKKPQKGKKELFKGKFVEYPTTKRATEKYLGIPWKFYYNFDFEIPIKAKENSKIDFRMIYEENGEKIVMENKIGFRYHSNLSLMSNYLIKDSLMVLFRVKSFYIFPYSFKKTFKLEMKALLRILKSRDDNFIKALLFRPIILALRPFMRNKRIWIFQDRPDVADDNAKHLFAYSTKKDDEIKKYYILEKSCKDYKEMKKIDKAIVNFYSLKHKILYCFAEKVISSHCNQGWLNPFYYNNFELYSGLVTVQRCFLQHGVTKDDVSWWFRKYYQNFYLLLTTSDLERNSMLSDNYNYREEVIQSLGFPRFDNLNNTNLKKQILFMPTWRKNLKTEEEFINSSFFKSLNGFFKDKELINITKENGYKILFKPHWNLLPFLNNFDIDEDIEIVEDVPYQKLFNESALLITDYSSVAFDFAYLQKPVIYLQETKYHYESGYYNYETMGFGDIVKSKDELIESVIKQIKNDCKMEDKYKQRVIYFFKHTDKNNCKRNYEWLFENK